MAQSAILKAETRTKMGTRGARALRAAGMIPANIQPTDGKDHMDFAISMHEFMTTRRAHVHLYDIEVGGDTETAVVRELQWDVFGDNIIHVEFKRVIRGVETESEVELAFVGNAKGVVNHLVHHVTILSLPSLIPDALEIKVDGLEEGTMIHASDIILPEGVSLAVDPETEVAAIAGAAGVDVEPEDDEEGPDGPEVIGVPAEGDDS